jgi:hypothetical protein
MNLFLAAARNNTTNLPVELQADSNGVLQVNNLGTGGAVVVDGSYSASLPTLSAGTNSPLQVNVNGRLFARMADDYSAPIAASWSSSTTTYASSSATGQWTGTNNVGLFAVNTSGMDTVIVTLVTGGSHSGGTVAFEVYDGSAWIPIKSASITDYTTLSTATLGPNYNKGYQVPVAGFPQFRCRLVTAPSAGTLTLTIVTSSAPDTSIVTVGLDPAQAVVPQATLTETTGSATSTSTALATPAAGAITKYFEIQNTGGTNPLNVNFGAAATSSNRIIAPGASWAPAVLPQQSINVYSASGTTYVVTWA